MVTWGVGQSSPSGPSRGLVEIPKTGRGARSRANSELALPTLFSRGGGGRGDTKQPYEAPIKWLVFDWRRSRQDEYHLWVWGGVGLGHCLRHVRPNLWCFGCSFSFFYFLAVFRRKRRYCGFGEVFLGGVSLWFSVLLCLLELLHASH